MTSVDRYLARKRTASYDCVAFVRDVWRDLGLGELGSSPRDLRRLERLDAPADPCIVVLRGGGQPHVGILLRGRVLHLLDGAAHQALDVVARGFRRVEFFR